MIAPKLRRLIDLLAAVHREAGLLAIEEASGRWRTAAVHRAALVRLGGHLADALTELVSNQARPRTATAAPAGRDRAPKRRMK